MPTPAWRGCTDAAGAPVARGSAGGQNVLYPRRTLKKLSAIRTEEEYLTAARETMDELERVIQADRNATSLYIEEGWDDTSLATEAKSVS